jgi:hypothetical protein
MNPNDLRQNDRSNPYTQRPIQDFGPARSHPTQRPMNDFGRPVSQKPMQNSMPPQPVQQPQQTMRPMTFEPPKKKKKIRTRKLLSAVSVAILLIACAYVFIATGNDSSKKTSVKVKAQNGQPAIKTLEKADFTTYYPNPMPEGLKAMKGSITYYKDSFTFILEQNGQKSFFVYEQPGSTDPDFNSLKGKLAAPKNIALTIGQGVEGELDNGTITAVKTDKDTIIIVDCVKAVCSTTAHDLLSNMQINSDLESLRRDNSQAKPQD